MPNADSSSRSEKQSDQKAIINKPSLMVRVTIYLIAKFVTKSHEKVGINSINQKSMLSSIL